MLMIGEKEHEANKNLLIRECDNVNLLNEIELLDSNNKLIQDRARVQLWSDLSHNGQSLSEGGWGALDLTYQAQAQAVGEMSFHKVSLAVPILYTPVRKELHCLWKS